MPPVKQTVVPLSSHAAGLIEGASFHDVWSITSKHIERSALDHFLVAAQRTPRWVNLAMAARNATVRLVGLKHLGALSDIDANNPSSDYKNGERVGGYLHAV